MREIKFRGMGLNGGWFIGNLAVIIDARCQVKPGSYISNAVGMPFAYPIRPETVGQFTGLLDKNGKEIYEGDIAKADGFYLGDSFIKANRGEIVFDNGGFYCRSVNETFGELNIEAIINYSVEVIGNIHENPELLK